MVKSEQHPNMREEVKEQWLKELSEFIVEANLNTWAADGKEITPERLGYKELEYRKGLWRLRDSYTGYFRAPGMTTVYYKDVPSWTMAYGGHGMKEGYEAETKETFEFLKAALRRVNPALPFRGPQEYEEGDHRYIFKLLDGDITDCLWKEEITNRNILTFTQTGIGGIVIHKDKGRKPILPWKS